MRRISMFWVVLIHFLTCSASNYFFRTVDVKNGLADNFVRDIVRDRHGYIWLSTINGLSSYDGYRLRSYLPLEFGGRGNDVSFVRETADSTLWMMCTNELFTFNRSRGVWQKDGTEKLEKAGIEGTVRVFYVDDRSNLWIATELGLYHYDYSVRKLQHFACYSKAPISHIISRNGTTVVLTSDNSVYEVVQQGSRLMAATKAPAMPYSRDRRIFLDKNMNLWVYHSHSPAGSQWVFSLKTRQWNQPSEIKQMGNTLVNVVAEDNNGNLLIGTSNAGVQLFGYKDNGTELQWITSMNVFKPSSCHISCIYVDSNNTMWVGSAKLGIAFTDMSSPNFNVVSTDSYEDVSSLVEDRQGNLWIGFDGYGVLRKSPNGEMTHFSAPQQLPSDIVTSLAIHTDGTLLVGTYSNGIARFDGTRFIPIHSDYPNLKYVKAMTADTHGNLWVATVDRGVVRVMPNGKIINYTSENPSLTSNGTLCLTYDPFHDIIYIGMSNGIAAYDCSKDRFVHIAQFDKLKGIYVTSLMVSNHTGLWIGTRNGLWVYSLKDGSIDHFTTEQGMSHNVVRALAMTNDKLSIGNESGEQLWASTDNGLTCISALYEGNRQIGYRCDPLYDSDGLHNIIFSNNASLTTSNGSALLGSFTGYVSILPENFIAHYPKLHVRFTGFQINGKTQPEEANGLRIKHGERLDISVSAMIPALNQKIIYLYRFKGDKEWLRAPGNTLYFASLIPGNHVLQVKAAMPSAADSKVKGDFGMSEIAELSIRVLPPFWLSNPMILLYLLLMMIAGYLIYKAMRLRQKRELAFKQLEVNLKKYEMEEEKISFFTNISHDIKTPISMVLAPLEKMRETHLPAAIRTEMDVAWRNARQLYDLVLQLLDFRRLDVGMEKLNYKHGDIVNFVRNTVQGFSYYASRRQIKLQMFLPPTPIEIDFDERKINRIITNLLSNAFKYNVENGSVTVSLDCVQKEEGEQIVFSVADTGIGVNDKRHIFDRFMQEKPKTGENGTSTAYGLEQEGSGLGLHIVRQYVDMMQGSITVTDNKPKGSVFIVTLPIVKRTDTNVEELPVTEAEKLAQPEYQEEQDKSTILVVDDNIDVRQFLQRSLDDQYHVVVAENGQEALRILAENEHISIVVTDVMMPVMDGIELFRRIKGNINYSHIPVILLTAKSSEENILTGLKEGVADYITKPFSLEVLRLRIGKILEWAQNVHSNVATGIEIKPSEITVSSLDEELISHVIADIEANIQDPSYSVTKLSSAVGMTRGNLYKKLMAITGKSPMEFIRIIKLKRGKSLLDQGRTNISEVADMVGISAKQFAHHFKMMYNDTPSEYLKKNIHKTLNH